MKHTTLSLLVLAALGSAVAQAQVPVNATNGSIGLVENDNYSDEAFNMPTNGVILGKDTTGIGHEEGGVVIGNNSTLSSEGVLVGSNSVNASTRGIVIGANSHAGSETRWKGYDKKIYTGDLDDPNDTVIIGNGTSVHGVASVVALGNAVKVNGTQTVALGHGSQVGTFGTAIGDVAQANAEGSVAIGCSSQANREAYEFGYNAVTGKAYSFDDFQDKLAPEDVAALKQLDGKRMELEQALAERKQQYEDAEKTLRVLHEKEAKTVFETFEEKNAFLQELATAKDVAQTASDAYYGDEYDALVAVKKELQQKAGATALSIQGTEGAVSVGVDNYRTRQITNVAAGSVDTDAVNVKQLKDYADVTNSKLDTLETTQTEQGGKIDGLTGALAIHEGHITAVEDRVTTAEGTIARHDVEIKDLQTRQLSEMQNINTRFNKMDKKLERGLASGAALAGLVQPYNVGKFNVTMALGTYRSTGAIAAGMGYRPTENFVIRGGIATNTENFQDLSTNIGVGFEF